MLRHQCLPVPKHIFLCATDDRLWGNQSGIIQMPQIHDCLRKGVKGIVMPLTLILSVSGYSSALETRNMVLQAAGYTVVPAQSIEEAMDQFLAGDFDLVLLDYDFPPRD